MQKRLFRRLDIEKILFKVKPPLNPKLHLEQYVTPVDIAAKILYLATYIYDDITGKKVLDLGCGTGIFSIGASLLGAKKVVGVDIDKSIIKTALNNSIETRSRRKIQWVVADAHSINGQFDTVLQNPPFGVHKRKADSFFLIKALENGKRIYSLHKNTSKDKRLIDKLKSSKKHFIRTSPSPFLRKFIESHGGEIKEVYSFIFSIPHMFVFHFKRKHNFLVDLYIIERK